MLQREGYEDLDAVRTESREEGKVEGKVEGKAEGKAEGMIAAVIIALKVRGIPVSDEQLARIRACRDVNTLDQWLRRAIAAEGDAKRILDG